MKAVPKDTQENHEYFILNSHLDENLIKSMSFREYTHNDVAIHFILKGKY